MHYKYGSRVITAYSEENIAAIVKRLGEMDMLYPSAPEGVVSLTGLIYAAVYPGHKEYREIYSDVQARAEKRLGKLPRYRFLSASSLGVSEEQLPVVNELIDEHVKRLQAFAVAREKDREAKRVRREATRRPEQHPEEYKTLRQIGEEQGVASKIYDKALATVLDQIGEVETYTHGPRGYRSFNPEQQQIIKAEIDKRKTNGRTDGRVTANEIGDALGVTGDLVRSLLKERAVPSLTEKVGLKPSPTYDSANIEELARDPQVIRLSHRKRAPEDIVSLTAFARGHHMRAEIARKVVEEYFMPLGEYGFGLRRRPGIGLQPYDQLFIEQALDERDKNGPDS